MTAIAKLDLALKLLDEVDATPLGQINTKLDRITDAVSAARRELQVKDLITATRTDEVSV